MELDFRRRKHGTFDSYSLWETCAKSSSKLQNYGVMLHPHIHQPPRTSRLEPHL